MRWFLPFSNVMTAGPHLAKAQPEFELAVWRAQCLPNLQRIAQKPLVKEQIAAKAWFWVDAATFLCSAKYEM